MVQALQGVLEERVALFFELQKKCPEDKLAFYRERLNMSWVYHDSALEGVVYTKDELNAAVSDDIVSDKALIPVYDEIRNHQAAIALMESWAAKKRFQITLESVKQLFGTLAPEELDGKPVNYRKDMPLHRLYFHEISQPDKIGYKMRQLIQWMNDPETKRSTHPIRLAARAHYTLLQIYPFPKLSGKVARLLLNLILLRSGYPPVVIHAVERQRYYDALKTSEDKVATLITQALASSVESGIQFFQQASK